MCNCVRFFHCLWATVSVFFAKLTRPGNNKKQVFSVFLSDCYPFTISTKLFLIITQKKSFKIAPVTEKFIDFQRKLFFFNRSGLELRKLFKCTLINSTHKGYYRSSLYQFLNIQALSAYLWVGWERGVSFWKIYITLRFGEDLKVIDCLVPSK